jgi:hypothetical protein
MGIPTVNDMRERAPWFWAHCTLPCTHRAALPWRAVMQRIRPEASADRLRAALWCVSCGRRGAHVSLIAPSNGTGRLTSIPVESVPDWARPWAEDEYSPGPAGHGCTSFTQRRPPTPTYEALERRRIAILARWKCLEASAFDEPTRADIREFIAVARALGRSEEQIAKFTRHFPEDWYQYPYRRPKWREIHDLYDETTPSIAPKSNS